MVAGPSDFGIKPVDGEIVIDSVIEQIPLPPLKAKRIQPQPAQAAETSIYEQMPAAPIPAAPIDMPAPSEHAGPMGFNGPRPFLTVPPMAVPEPEPVAAFEPPAPPIMEPVSYGAAPEPVSEPIQTPHIPPMDPLMAAMPPVAGIQPSRFGTFFSRGRFGASANNASPEPVSPPPAPQPESAFEPQSEPIAVPPSYESHQDSLNEFTADAQAPIEPISTVSQVPSFEVLAAQLGIRPGKFAPVSSQPVVPEPESEPEPIYQAAPVYEPAPEPVRESVPDIMPTFEQAADPVADYRAEPLHVVPDPEPEIIAEPVIEAVAELIIEPVIEPEPPVHGEVIMEPKPEPQPEIKNLPARPGHMLQRLIDSSSAEAAAGGAARLGDRLIDRGWITPEQLKVALQEKKMTGKMLGQVLVDLEFITDAQLSEILAEASGYEVFDAKNTIVDGEALALVTKEQAMKMQILPISMIDGEVMVAMVDPQDIVALDRLRRVVPKGMTVRPLMTTPSVISEAIDAAYGYSSDVEAILAEMDNANPEDLAKVPESGVYTHPVVRLVNTLVAEAVKSGVSDLHWEPEENFVRLRYRLDGVLFTAQILHKKHWSPIAQRIKILSGMNIADKLSPQDGRFELKFGPRSADFRVNVLPTVFGENIVMRVLDRTASILPLEKLGFSVHNMDKINWAQSRPEGIIIVTGPTGSGKSTSLYSMINAINNVQVNIQTLEDPVEYSLPMIRQTPVREGILDFADGIRALLRQDPDIIFIGEIRDGTTAEMALKAAMTGHQVYTTLHTNDSFGAIPRLLDLGLKPGMISGALIAIFAQRLARRLCQSCREQYTPDAEECRLLQFDPASPPSIFRARQGGCSACRGQGYKGRIALAEILTFDEELDEIISRGGTKGELRKRAIEKGFKSMKDDAILKITEGITTFESAATCVDFTR